MFKNLPALFVGAFLILGAGVVIWRMISPTPAKTVIVDVEMPALSFDAQRGQKAFTVNCAQCHGAKAEGTDQGPPLIHDIYNPGHHADEAIRRAAAFGVRRHHWSFGDMPAQKQVKPSEMNTIISFIREVQMANGIVAKPHKM